MIDQSPFTLSVIEKVGDAGISFGVTEAAGVGTINYTSNGIGAGDIRYVFRLWGV